MSGRSRLKLGRAPLAPRPAGPGRHLRRILRRNARVMAGDWTANLISRPLDVELQALYKPLVRAHATRRSAKV